MEPKLHCHDHMLKNYFLSQCHYLQSLTKISYLSTLILYSPLRPSLQTACSLQIFCKEIYTLLISLLYSASLVKFILLLMTITL
jgi:hypothetical protein